MIHVKRDLLHLKNCKDGKECNRCYVNIEMLDRYARIGQLVTKMPPAMALEREHSEYRPQYVWRVRCLLQDKILATGLMPYSALRKVIKPNG